jgi:hypothetical protein
MIFNLNSDEIYMELDALLEESAISPPVRVGLPTRRFLTIKKEWFMLMEPKKLVDVESEGLIFVPIIFILEN